MSPQQMIWSVRKEVMRLAFWSLALAVATAGYGALVGPLLKALFGGSPLIWPDWLAGVLPPPPNVSTLRSALPLVIVGVSLLKGLAFHRHAVGTVELGQSVVGTLRRAFHSRILAMPPDVAARFGVGDLSSRCTHDADVTERWLTVGLAGMLRDGLQVVALFGLCVLIDPALALLTFCIYPIAFWPIARFARRLRRAAGEAHSEHARYAAHLHDDLSRLSLIQLSGAEGIARERHGQAVGALAKAMIKTIRVRSLASPFTEVMGALALAGTLIYATGRIESGALAAEHVLSFFVGVLLLYQPVKGLVRAHETIQPGLAAFERLQEVLAVADLLPQGGSEPLPETIEVRCEHVHLERGGQAVLVDLNLTLSVGITVVVGPNGAGKTSLAWLVAGMIEPTQGRVVLNGRDLACFDLPAWRQAIGWVTQADLLGRGTIRENVCFGHESVTSEALDDVAELTGLEAVVARLPLGWETPLGDAGVGLSGGERRRIALARALLRRPRVLILDEPEAHLDTAGLTDFGARLPSIAKGRVVLLLTHDESLAALATQRLDLGAHR